VRTSGYRGLSAVVQIVHELTGAAAIYFAFGWARSPQRYKEGDSTPAHWVFHPSPDQEFHLLVEDGGTRALNLYETAARTCWEAMLAGLVH
jgi:hypothetical protein